MSPLEVFLANLRKVRHARGLSRVAAGRLVGLSPAGLGAHEAGHRSVTLDQAVRYAEAYGVAVVDLFDPVLAIPAQVRSTLRVAS